MQFKFIIIHVSLVFVLKYKPCCIPLKYRCPIRKSDHIRLTYLSQEIGLSKIVGVSKLQLDGLQPDVVGNVGGQGSICTRLTIKTCEQYTQLLHIHFFTFTM